MASHQMPRQQCTKHTCATGNQHRAFGIQRPGHAEDQLADVARTTQESIGIQCVSDVPRTRRKGMQLAVLEKLHELAEDLLSAVGTGLEDIESSILNARMPCRDLAGCSDVGLAHLDESPATRQKSQPCVDKFACQRIEYDVNARPAGHLGKFLLELNRARVRDVVVVESHA